MTTIALAGNPNVGKSTVFNALTGLQQHTGNWPGKTVETAHGRIRSDQELELVDLPGCYSLLATSEEEALARDFICFENPACVVVVCDATAPERNLNLALQVIETGRPVIICMNLLDEAAKRSIHVDPARLAEVLHVPVLGTAARNGEGLDALVAMLKDWHLLTPANIVSPYPPEITAARNVLAQLLKPYTPDVLSPEWLAIRLLEDAPGLQEIIERKTDASFLHKPEIVRALALEREQLAAAGYDEKHLRDAIVESFVLRAEQIAAQAVSYGDIAHDARDRRWDRFFTGRRTGFISMFMLLLFVFWLTIEGSNYPSELLADMLFTLQDWLLRGALALGIPEAVYNPLIFGVYRVMAWVISVMLPPMAIFFPLFTLLEDFGYLPRIAYNLDRAFQTCRACGKQALTMCMGFGCNAAGVTGARIIDSPRERLIAILTNNFVPCNGRFPLFIALIAMFWAGTSGAPLESFGAAFLLTSVIVLGVVMTLVASRLLSATVLRGVPSAFTLELPPYRRPQVVTVLIRSLLDRTLFVLFRAVVVAAPAGFVIWYLANTPFGETNLIDQFVHTMEPFGHAMGMDGAILTAFILGMPANEIVFPCLIMIYLAQTSILELDSLQALHGLLVEHGWTWLTALCTMLFSLLHWPCGTTILTIYRETKSLYWTALSVLLPTSMGVAVCITVAALARLVFPEL